MVQSTILALDGTQGLLERPRNLEKELSWRVTDTDHPGSRVSRNRLSDDPRGICEVDDPGRWSHPLDDSRVLDCDRYSAQSHGETCGPGGLLAGEAALQRPSLD